MIKQKSRDNREGLEIMLVGMAAAQQMIEIIDKNKEFAYSVFRDGEVLDSFIKLGEELGDILYSLSPESFDSILKSMQISQNIYELLGLIIKTSESPVTSKLISEHMNNNHFNNTRKKSIINNYVRYIHTARQLVNCCAVDINRYKKEIDFEFV